jgi:putative Mn2+ efflux pump MntP
MQSFFRRTATASAEAADVLVALVIPASLIAMALGLWRLTADVGWTQTFPISTGFFSHWQVWIALAIALKFGASALLTKVRAEHESHAAQATDRPA